MWIVFIGPPGAGKGTQCKRLIDHLSLPHLSTGDLLRETKEGSALGKVVASYIDCGKLAPDDLVIRLVTKVISDSKYDGGCLFDGFPRTVPQAKMLGEHLADRGAELNVVVYLTGDRDELISRIVQRGIREGRADDTPETITERLEVYDRQTKPVLDYYAETGKVVEIDGMQSSDDVFDSIVAAMPGRESTRDR